VSKKEFLKAAGKIYTDLEKGKTAKKANDDVEKKKREPTKYNLFMRSEMAVLKAQIQNGEVDAMTNREMMAHVAKQWQEKKLSDDEKADVKADDKKEAKSAVKKQVKKVEKPVAKKTAKKDEKKAVVEKKDEKKAVVPKKDDSEDDEDQDDEDEDEDDDE
jgi:hypothetical protein